MFSYLVFFLLQVETFIEISGNKLFWERLCSGRKGFSTQWKLFSFILCFFPAGGPEKCKVNLSAFNLLTFLTTFTVIY